MNLSNRGALTQVLKVALKSVILTLLFLNAAAQEGYFEVGQDKWHLDFYKTLRCAWQDFKVSLLARLVDGGH